MSLAEVSSALQDHLEDTVGEVYLDLGDRERWD